MTAFTGEVWPDAAGVEDVSFGKQLMGRLVRPAGRPKAAIVLHGAVGVPMGYYRGFADWLAGQGYACLTYDYRDFGASAQGPMRKARATLADWGIGDQPAALSALRKAVPGVPVWVIGHSLGGLMLGFNPGMAGVARVITVASGPVHLSDHPWPYRALAAFFWTGVAAMVAVAGYLPGRLTGFGSDLPSGVYWQWRRWCTQRGNYLADAGHSVPMPDMGVVEAPMTVIAVADDPVVPQAAVWRLMALYPQAIKRQRVLRPAEFGLASIGHLGAFSRRNSVVWPQIIA
ncbi:MAG: alpha/beta hydrolase family protein [Paracoccaceae bacterium]